MKTNKERIQELIDPILASQDAWLVELLLRGEKGETVVQALVDTDEGISIGRCAEISRELGRQMEAEGLFESRYRLEVSSPGLDRPLRLLRQYQKNKGRKFNVRYRAPEGEKTAALTLQGVEGENILWQADDKSEMTIPHAQILDCRVELPW